VTAPMRMPVPGGSVTALEPAPNVTNVARKATLLAIALPVVLVADTADTAAAKATAVADTVGGALPIRIATHAEALATWLEIALRGRDRSAITVGTLYPNDCNSAFANRVVLQAVNLGI
jgi:hypothetical protein